MIVTPLKIVLVTRRGLRTLSLNAFAFFGFVSAIIQLYSAVYVPQHSFNDPFAVIVCIVLASIVFGFVRTWPRSSVSRTFTASAHDITVRVMVGDILNHRGQIVIGFSDTFDTDTDGDKVISTKSLQGQFLARRFNNNQSSLDKAIVSSLKNIKPVFSEKRSDKTLGKLARYPIGTVAVIGDAQEGRVYALAYSNMRNDLVAESSVHDVWYALGQLWNSVYTHGQQQSIAMPLVGTGLARINYLDRESMLRMTLISYVARSREKLVCDELTVYIHPSDRDKINMLELAAFLKTL